MTLVKIDARTPTAALPHAQVTVELFGLLGGKRRQVTVPVVDSDGAAVVDRHAATLDASGSVTLDLAPNESMTPAGTWWRVTIVRPSDRAARIYDADVPVVVDPETVVPLADVLIETPDTLGILTPVDVGGATDGQAMVLDDGVWRPASLATLAALEAVEVTADAAMPKVGGPAPSVPSGVARLVDVDDRVSGRQHTGPASGWTAGVAAWAEDRPLRVVCVGDSIEELDGFNEAWDRMHGHLSGDTDRGRYFCPGSVFGAVTHPVRTGVTNAEVGLDRQGVTVTGELGTEGTLAPRSGTVVEVLYTAAPGGGTFELQILDAGGAAHGDPVVVDTSEDEDGAPVAAATPGQLVRVSGLVHAQWDYLITVTAGTVSVEGDAVWGPGLHRYGSGLSGQSTAEANAGGQVVPVVAAMVARGEAPDLVWLACETGDTGDAASDTPGEVVAHLDEMLTGLRQVAPLASYALYVPPAHTGAKYADWPEFVAAMREWAIASGVLLVDAYHGLGVGGDWHTDPLGYALDGVHPSDLGAAALSALLLDTLWSRTTTPDATAATPGQVADAVAAATLEGLADVDADMSAALPGELLAVVGGELVRSGATAEVVAGVTTAVVSWFMGVVGRGWVTLLPGGLSSYDPADVTARPAVQVGGVVVTPPPEGETGTVTLGELAAAPAAPGANTVVLYADDSGGKTRLMARFATGAAQQVAIQP